MKSSQPNTATLSRGSNAFITFLELTESNNKYPRNIVRCFKKFSNQKSRVQTSDLKMNLKIRPHFKIIGFIGSRPDFAHLQNLRCDYVRSNWWEPSHNRCLRTIVHGLSFRNRGSGISAVTSQKIKERTEDISKKARWILQFSAGRINKTFLAYIESLAGCGRQWHLDNYYILVFYNCARWIWTISISVLKWMTGLVWRYVVYQN